MNKQITTADLIGEYIRLRDAIDARQKKFDAEMKPYHEGMQVIAAVVGEQIEKQGGDSLKTAKGTAYRSTTLSARCSSREAFLNYVFAHDLRELITSAVSKDALKEHLERSGGAPPPGIDITYVHKINFRKPTD